MSHRAEGWRRNRGGLVPLGCAVLLLGGLLSPVRSGAEPGFRRSEERIPCARHEPLRQPLFGDTHVHSTLSFDAWVQGTRNTPRDAYRFARGEAVGVQPYRADGTPLRTVRLRTPLDFAMVSDHAEMLGEAERCRTPGSPGHDRFACVLLRRWPALGYMIVNSQWGGGRRHVGLCAGDEAGCRRAAAGPWRVIQDAAEEAYDRSAACRFTTFVGFEWSGSRGGMIHRNVLFRNARVPIHPANAIDDGNDETRLWARLETECIATDTGCDVLAIPHNSNLSGGEMFWTRGPGGAPLTAALARRRAALEPLVEITQHKGDSECRAGGSDELCGFETLAFGDVAGHASRLYRGPVPERVYLREALLEGLVQEAALGVNPFALGVIGATDTHLGTPGLVDEDAFVGHAAGVVSARLAVPPLPDHPLFNPGGLAGVWAEENSRDAIFAALRRREVFGTSGPRIVVRFYGGWELDPGLCGARRFAAQGDAQGVPMGGALPRRPEHASAPRFAVRALRDPGSTGPAGEAPGTGPAGEGQGTGLERIQIVKGWLDSGTPRQRVMDVVRGAPAEELDLATCRPPRGGADTLCQVWEDPDFDPEQRAFYYARVVEVPSCRWTQHACLAAGIVCAMTTPAGPLAACCDASVPKTIQERAWTSPIWYTPPSNP